jgi:hypothetical protein
VKREPMLFRPRGEKLPEGPTANRVSLSSFIEKSNRRVDHNHDYYDFNHAQHRHFVAS